MLARIRKSREDEGFTLIELLVVIIIIGILSAIAIPTFLNQRQKAWKKASQSDLRNSATKMEEYFDGTGSYAGATAANAGFKNSEDVTVTVAGTPGVNGYCLKAVHAKLNATTEAYWFDSKVGRPVMGAAADCSATSYA